MKLSKEALQEMEQADIRDAVLETLTDISGMEIDREQPVAERVEAYIEAVGNPFLVRVGEYVVKIGYSDCEETLNDRMRQYIQKTAEIKY